MTNADPATLPKKRRGCFFYGCITCLVLALVLGLGLFIAVRFAVHKLNGMVAQYTDSTSMELPKTQMPADDLKKLEDRVAAYHHAMDLHSNVPPLVLTGPEINALLANTPNLKNYKDKFFISLDGEEIRGQVSLPLDAFVKTPLLDVKGRYLNGGGTFKAAISNGMLFVTIESLEVKGKALPPDAIRAFQKQNLAEKFNDGKNNAAFQQYESVEVKDSTLIIQPKQN